MTVQRVLRQTQAQPEVTFYVGTVATDADAAVTVTITRADGTVFATDAATTHIGTNTGLYRYTLAPQTALELFTFDWKGTFGGVVQHVTSQVEIVGGYVVALADLKAESGMGTKTDAQLAEARQWFEDAAEAYCGVAFVPRYAREVLDGDGTFELGLIHPFPRSVLSCKVGGITQTGTSTWDLYEEGLIARDSGSFAVGRRNVEITYEHGLDTVPSDIRDAALTAIRSNVLGGGSAGGGIPAGVTQLATDAGVMTFGRRTFPFGIPEVDTVLSAHRLVVVG
jgi:hypothetical protein